MKNLQMLMVKVRGVYWIILMLIFSGRVSAQERPDTLSRTEKIEVWKTINQDIWLPFSEAFATNNAEQYIGLHTKDFLRISRDGIQTKEIFAERNRNGFARRKQDSRVIGIDFRLLERITSAEYSSERGIFRTVVNKGLANERSFYGKFHVVLRKENGVWKILMDYDSDEKGTINASSFEQAYRIDDFEKYLNN